MYSIIIIRKVVIELDLVGLHWVGKYKIYMYVCMEGGRGRRERERERVSK